MKRRLLIWAIVLLGPLMIRAQTTWFPPEEIRVEVTGDTVMLFQDSVLRNCGATYSMFFLLQADTLIWFQEDTGAAMLCNCQFNLSLAVDSLSAGSYIAAVYFTVHTSPSGEPDTLFAGSAPFTILKPIVYERYHKLNESQSECLDMTGIPGEGEADESGLTIYPNPASSRTTVRTDGEALKTIRILDLRQRCLFSTSCTGMSHEIDVSDYPAGIYIISVQTGDRIYREKLIRRSGE